jgi:DNA-binding PucR family transcriptional regulator
VLAGWPLHAAGRLGAGTLVIADDHLLDLLIAADERLIADLVTRRLAPLAGMTPAGRRRAEETLRAWLDAHGDVARAAAALHVHPQTVRYRLGTLHEAFGEVLDHPAARLELDLALRAVAASRGV